MNMSYILYQSPPHLTAVLPVSLSTLTVKVHEKLEWHSVDSIPPSRPGDIFKSVTSNPIWNRTYLKVRCVEFGKKLIKLNKQTELKGQHSFILFYFVYMWQTLPLFQLRTVFCGPYFPLRTACLFNYGNWPSLVSVFTPNKAVYIVKRHSGYSSKACSVQFDLKIQQHMCCRTRMNPKCRDETNGLWISFSLPTSVN